MLPVQLLGHGELVEMVGGPGARQDATALAPQHVVRLLARRALVHVEHTRHHKSQLVKLRAYESPQTQHSRLPRLTELCNNKAVSLTVLYTLIPILIAY